MMNRRMGRKKKETDHSFDVRHRAGTRQIFALILLLVYRASGLIIEELQQCATPWSCMFLVRGGDGCSPRRG